MIMFTGSTRDRQEGHGASAAETLTPVSLELGGKDPMIVLSDADLERAANAARLLLDAERGPDVHLDRARLRRGAGLRRVRREGHREGARRCARATRPAGRARVEVGAITFPQADGDHRGPRQGRGRQGRADRRRRPAAARATGTFFEPTVMVDVDHTMKAMTEETFGPTLPIMKVRDAEEAIRLANDSPYGLAASVFGKDIAPRRAGRAPRSRPAPSSSTTRCSTTRRSSCRWAAGRRAGLGSRHGAGGIRKYCAEQAILLTRFVPKKDVHMFPYKAGRTKLLGQAVRPAVRARQARLAATARRSPRPGGSACAGASPTSPAA